MNFRHAAALALAGVHLMTPPDARRADERSWKAMASLFEEIFAAA